MRRRGGGRAEAGETRDAPGSQLDTRCGVLWHNTRSDRQSIEEASPSPKTKRGLAAQSEGGVPCHGVGARAGREQMRIREGIMDFPDFSIWTNPAGAGGVSWAFFCCGRRTNAVQRAFRSSAAGFFFFLFSSWKALSNRHSRSSARSRSRWR